MGLVYSVYGLLSNVFSFCDVSQRRVTRVMTMSWRRQTPVTHGDATNRYIAGLCKIGSFRDGPLETVKNLRFHLKQQNGKKLAVKAWGWSRNVWLFSAGVCCLLLVLVNLVLYMSRLIHVSISTAREYSSSYRILKLNVIAIRLNHWIAVLVEMTAIWVRDHISKLLSRHTAEYGYVKTSAQKQLRWATVWPQYTLAENWRAVPLLGWGAGSPCNTIRPGPRPTIVPSGILIHQAVLAQ